MSSLHEHYDKLPLEDRKAVDAAYLAMNAVLRKFGVPITGDDRAEKVVDAIARGILESRMR